MKANLRGCDVEGVGDAVGVTHEHQDDEGKGEETDHPALVAGCAPEAEICKSAGYPDCADTLWTDLQVVADNKLHQLIC